MKKLSLLALLLVSVLILGACGRNQEDEAPLIGIAMPTSSSLRWIDDGDSTVEQLEALGFRTILQYGEDVVADQVAQIQNMIVQGVDVLVIASIDGGALTGVLAEARAAGIPVIAYDRLIMGSPYVDFYTTFDNFQVGVIQATYIVEYLGLHQGAQGPYNIELFGGSPDDNNAFFFYDGAMSVLQPHIDAGRLVVRSGQVGMAAAGTLGWQAERAQSRMEDLLVAYYADARVDAVLSPYDGLSLGIISALRGAGYGTAAQPWPVISGQDAVRPAVQSIINGELTMTVFKDTRNLAAATVRMVEAIINGTAVPVNDTTTYNNGIMYVPTYLLPIQYVDLNNWMQVLVTDSGFYSADEFDVP